MIMLITAFLRGQNSFFIKLYTNHYGNKILKNISSYRVNREEIIRCANLVRTSYCRYGILCISENSFDVKNAVVRKTVYPLALHIGFKPVQ